jgi:hypothetical protein
MIKELQIVIATQDPGGLVKFSTDNKTLAGTFESSHTPRQCPSGRQRRSCCNYGVKLLRTWIGSDE